ncbi:hypothetical protein OF83DRAFT_1113965 [Amylostereum chailletii]|nr:hypothetical protein OF83DRAFT_1113965 [Amylostereum chailletii]
MSCEPLVHLMYIHVPWILKPISHCLRHKHFLLHCTHRRRTGWPSSYTSSKTLDGYTLPASGVGADRSPPRSPPTPRRCRTQARTRRRCGTGSGGQGLTEGHGDDRHLREDALEVAGFQLAEPPLLPSRQRRARPVRRGPEGGPHSAVEVVEHGVDIRKRVLPAGDSAVGRERGDVVGAVGTYPAPHLLMNGGVDVGDGCLDAFPRIYNVHSLDHRDLKLDSANANRDC